MRLRPVLVNDSQTVTLDTETSPLDTAKSIEYPTPLNTTGNPFIWQKVFHVTSVDGLHTEAYTINFTVNPKLNPIAPLDPTNIQAYRNITRTLLSWDSYTPLTQGSSPIAGYFVSIFQYDPDGNFMPGIADTSHNFPAALTSDNESTTSVAIRSLLEGYSYCFAIQAYNSEALSAVTGSDHPATFPENDPHCVGPLQNLTSNSDMLASGLRVDDSGLTIEGSSPLQNFEPFGQNLFRYTSTFSDESSMLVFQPRAPSSEIQLLVASPGNPGLRARDSLTSSQGQRFQLQPGISNYFFTATTHSYDVYFAPDIIQYQYTAAVGHAFGSTPRGKSSPNVPFYLQNTEDEAVTVGLSVTGSGFAITSQDCGTLTAMHGLGLNSEKCTVNLKFAPSAITPDASTGSLVVTYQSIGGAVLKSYAIPLRGEANSTNTRTLTWSANPILHVSDTKYSAVAMSSLAGSNAVTYAVTSDNGSGCTTSGIAIAIQATGDCTITASIPAQTIGGVSYPVVSASRLFHVVKSITSANLGRPQSLGGSAILPTEVGKIFKAPPILATGLVSENFSVVHRIRLNS